MKGLLVWAQSSCRSQMALYRELGKAFAVPVHVAVWFYRNDPNYVDNRTAIGFSDDEFADMTILKVGENWDRGLQVLDTHKNWTHLFCCYQWSPVFRQLQLEASRRGERTAIGSESPCNMFFGWRRMAKEIYFRTLLPRKVRDVIRVSDFFINYSGDDDRLARIIGWPHGKIIPFGYYPPPLTGTNLRQRTTNSPFEILITGEMTWHRGSDIILRALEILHRNGLSFHATFTQSGPLLEKLQSAASAGHLPVDFVGLLPMAELHRAYENCSVYVGAGRCEPWGMRLNDALNCGAPLVVSTGMGGVKMIDNYNCGLAFRSSDSQDLANQLMKLATDRDLYLQCARNAFDAAAQCTPQHQACRLTERIKKDFSEWLT